MFTPANEIYKNTIDSFDGLFIQQKINELSQIIKESIEKNL